MSSELGQPLSLPWRRPIEIAPGWAEANQRDLTAALVRVRRLLSERVETPGNGSSHAGRGALRAPEPRAEDAALAPFAIERLTRLFGLSPFERDTLLLCAGVELDARFGPLVALASGDPSRRSPTFGLALAVLPDAHWSALAPDAPLRAWRLIEMAGPSLTSAELRIDERILHALAGIETRDERLEGIVHELPESAPRESMVGRIAAISAHLGAGAAGASAHLGPGSLSTPIVQIVGAGVGARAIAAAGVASMIGARLLRVRTAALPDGSPGRHALVRLMSREALLDGALLLVEVSDDAAREGLLGELIEAVAVPTIVSTAEPLARLAGRAPVFETPVPSGADLVATWRKSLGPAVSSLNGTLAVLAAQFRLEPDVIDAVVERAKVPGEGGPAVDPSELWRAARAAARPRMDGLAQRIEPVATWDDLIVPETERRTLRQIGAQVRQRHQVYEEWGFAARSSRGLGIAALFSGPSGTGKTMAAEALARELRLDLYRIDLATVVSKYVGETEKNLKGLFDAAEGSGAILLFDEADALFGKRSEVRDSHDRYANVEIGYLLQRIEAYAGLAVLTTNMREALDPAFLRRIRFVVSFPFPDAPQREEIWHRIFPARTPTFGLDYERLAQLAVAGGNIRNIALGAAFLAADRNEPVAMGHLAEAARTEYAKLERSLGEAETRGWA